MKREHKFLSLADFKMKDGGNGSFSGYVSTFGNIDEVNEVVDAGAFTDDIQRFVKDGWITVNHNWNIIPVATITTAREDAKGLFVEAEFHSTVAAQDVRTTMKERYDRGKSVKFSIGYSVLEDYFQNKTRHLKKIQLFEASYVNLPANTQADAVGVKGLLGDNVEMGVSLAVLDSLYWRLWDTLYNQLRDPHTTQSLAAVFDEFRDIMLTTIAALDQSSSSKSLLSALDSLRTRASVSLKSLPDDLTAELKAGRTLSAANIARLQKHIDSLLSTADDLKELVTEAVDDPNVIKARQQVKNELDTMTEQQKRQIRNDILETELRITLEMTEAR